jgi:hypothetical protein
MRCVHEQHGALVLFGFLKQRLQFIVRKLLLCFSLRWAGSSAVLPGTNPQRLHFIPIFFKKSRPAECFKRIPVAAKIISLAWLTVCGGCSPNSFFNCSLSS